MKIITCILILSFPVFTSAQQIDIFTKWTAKIEDNVQIILDLSSFHSIGLTRIKVFDDNNYRIDSFGYKRRFNTFFVDVDSTTVLYSGSLQPLHEKLDPEMRMGMIQVVDKNYKGIPEKIKLSGDMPELSLYLGDGDTLSFTRMVTKEGQETRYQYFTYYGGEVSYTRYTGEHGGFSMEIQNVGLQFSPMKLNKSLTHRICTQVIAKINALRREKSTDSLYHDLVLDPFSRHKLNEWKDLAKKKHRINSYPEFEPLSMMDSLIPLNQPDQFNFIHYPFRCGQNATAIQLAGTDLSSRRKSRKHIAKHYQEYTDALLTALLNNSGAKQNILSSGYAGIGSSLVMYEAVKDDFYFDHNGKKIAIKDKKIKYYYLMISQSFSVYENQ